MNNTLPTRHGASGFTLVEVVVAMAVMSLLMLVLYDGLHLGMSSWTGGMQREDHSDALRRTERFLQGQLGRVHLPLDRSANLTGELSYRGEPSAMRFMGRLPEHTGNGALYRFELGVERSGVAQRLVVRYVADAAYGGAVGQSAAPASEVLVEDIAGAHFDYFGIDERGQWRWSERWDRPRVLPALVRLKLQSNDAGSRPWPTLVFQVREGDRWLARVGS